jgi:hypothetical protein
VLQKPQTKTKGKQTMKRKIANLMLAFGLASACGFAQDKPPVLTREDAILVSLTATIQAIDADKRELTLKGPLGNVVVLTVDKRVKRLKEFKVGDRIAADYYVAFAAELREPTAEEKASPLTMLEAKAKAPPGTDPAAGGLRMFKVVTTVEGLDRPTQSVTVKGPRGNYVTARVKHPENLEKLRLGDNIVVTYAEALAVSLEKKKPHDGSE